MASAMNRVTDTLKSQASAARETAEAAREKMQNFGSEAREMAEDALEQARDSGSELYAQGCERLGGLRSSIEQCIRDQPLRSLLVAAGVGCLVGAFWIRRR